MQFDRGIMRIHYDVTTWRSIASYKVKGNWIEATTRRPFTSMGVQFLGDYMSGWASVLFDGEEVWRGDTSAIWNAQGRYGGYIEISGFEPGKHRVRVEQVDVDSRPVVVFFFGFGRQDGVEPE